MQKYQSSLVKLFQIVICSGVAVFSSLPCAFIAIAGSLSGDGGELLIAYLVVRSLASGIIIGLAQAITRAPFGLRLFSSLCAFPIGFYIYVIVDYLIHGPIFKPWSPTEQVLMDLILVAISVVVGLIPLSLWKWRVANLQEKSRVL
jgi:hypothetical protein